MISIDEAQEIMGTDLLRPNEMAKAIGIPQRLKFDYLTLLKHVPYRAEVLKKHAGEWILWPGFPQSLQDLQFRFPKEFYYSAFDQKVPRPSRRYRYNSERFFERNRVGRGWYLTQKRPIHTDDNEDFLTVNFRNSSSAYDKPFCCQMAMLLLGYRFLRGIRLLPNNVVLCYDGVRRQQEGYFMNLGLYQDEGIGLWQVEPCSVSSTSRLFHRCYDTGADYTPFKAS